MIFYFKGQPGAPGLPGSPGLSTSPSYPKPTSTTGYPVGPGNSIKFTLKYITNPHNLAVLITLLNGNTLWKDFTVLSSRYINIKLIEYKKSFIFS